MTVTVLGSGTCVPLPSRATPGYLLSFQATPVLLDPGPGSLVRLSAAGVDYRQLEFVILSHLHPDHTLDLITLLQASNATPGFRRSLPLNIIGCKGLSAFLRRLFEVYEGIEPEGFALNVRELGAESVNFPTWRLEAGMSRHTPASLSFRFESEGKALAYSGDSSASGDLARLAQGADLLLCECSLPDGWSVPDHLSAGQVGAIAAGAGVGRVALTHLYPPALEVDVVAQVKAFYRGEVTLAADGWSTVL
jgi:ribonuclease BN (tRNA processing enzyme)